MKRNLFLLAAFLIIIGIVCSSCGTGAMYTIGICQQAPHKALDSATEGFMDALKAELGEEIVDFLEQNAQGESTSCTSIINNFVNRGVDLILADGTMAAKILSGEEKNRKYAHYVCSCIIPNSAWNWV